ncbi:thiol-activated cytolysin family protein [Flavobacterium sp.]|uniref:thiol-activated cytolysin family protein n=1 Tax=Flavobacterium sp. TaxID=239 RepID=UPI003D0D0D80
MNIRYYLFLMASLLLSCEADNVDAYSLPKGASDEANNEVVAKLNDLENPPIQAPIPIGDPVNVGEDAENLFYEQSYEEADDIPELNLLDTKSDIFYPGALFDGQSVLDARYEPIAVDRNNIIISTSLNGSGQEVSVNVENPKLSTVRAAVNNLISQDFDVPPANMTYDITEVHDENQLRIALGAAYEGGIGSIKGSFDFSKRGKISRTVFKFKQIYYTLDLDLPNSPSDFFKGELNPEVFKGKTPVYVSSVTFGRQIFLTVESSMSATEVKASLQAMFKFGGQFTANAEVEFSKISSSSSIKSTVVGGGAGSAATNIGSLADLKSLVAEGGKFGKDNPGVPVSYTLRTLKDNKKFVTVLGAKYKKAFFRPKPFKSFDARFRVMDIVDTFVDDVAPSNFDLVKVWGNGSKSSENTRKFSYVSLKQINFDDEKIYYKANLRGQDVYFFVPFSKIKNKYDKCKCDWLFTDSEPLRIQGENEAGVKTEFYLSLEISSFKAIY